MPQTAQSFRKLSLFHFYRQCQLSVGTPAIKTPRASSDHPILCPFLALLLPSPVPIVPCRVPVLCRCHSCVTQGCRTGAGSAVRGEGRAVPSLSPCCPLSVPSACSHPRRHSLGRECGLAAKLSPALPMFLMLFCFSGGARSGSSSVCERG